MKYDVLVRGTSLGTGALFKSPVPVRPKSNLLVDILTDPDNRLLENEKGQKTDNHMQATTTKPRLQHSGIRIAKGNSGQKPLRKPKAENQDNAAVIGSGILALNIKPRHYLEMVPKHDYRSNDHLNKEKIYNDLYPAYLRFTELSGVVPKTIKDKAYTGNTILKHLQELLGPKHEVDIFWDMEHNVYQLIYVTPMYSHDDYACFFYNPIKKLLKVASDKKYLSLFQKSLNKLRTIGFLDWKEVNDFIFDWDDWEEQDSNGDLPEPHELAERRAQIKLKYSYDFGKAAKALATIRKAILTEKDITRIKKYDQLHPIVQFTNAVWALSLENKCVGDYSEEPDDENETFLWYGEQFAIYYDFDNFFERQEEFINEIAQNGPQQPRMCSYITAEMPKIRDTEDNFTELIASFYNQFSSLERLLTEYKNKITSDGKN